jgi:hypothetical protein
MRTSTRRAMELEGTEDQGETGFSRSGAVTNLLHWSRRRRRKRATTMCEADEPRIARWFWRVMAACAAAIALGTIGLHGSRGRASRAASAGG